MALQTTYDVVGIREDVADVITNIDPTKTPFQTSIRTESVDNTRHDWLEDTLATVVANAQLDGFTAQAPQVAALATPGTYVGSLTASPLTVRTNFTQILAKVIRVSGTADRVNKYGRDREIAYQMAKRAAEAKRDLEHAMVGLNQTGIVGNATTARLMSSYTTLTDASVRVVNGAPTALTEAMLVQANQNLFVAGSEASIFMIKPADAVAVANWAYRAPIVGVANGPSERGRSVGATTQIVNAVDMYRSPFGDQKIVINRFLNTQNALLYDPEMWRLLVLRGWFRETLGKVGDNTAMMLVGEFSLKHRNFRGSTFINNLT
jgi:hypothetical protein